MLVSLFSVASCSHQRVLVNRTSDSEMTCEEIRSETTKMEKLLQDIDSKTGFSGRNIGMGILFWPGIIVNQINASDATILANDRLSVLAGLYRKKNCSADSSK